MQIGILDYGSGNIGALLSMSTRLGIPAQRISTRQSILDAEILLVPGVGNTNVCLELLQRTRFADQITKRFDLELPIIAVCSGFQCFGEKLEESLQPGLGLIPFNFLKLSSENGLVPQMGWKKIRWSGNGNTEGPFYFSHSYSGINKSDEISFQVSNYQMGTADILASLKIDYFHGIQFHPEKSSKNGRDYFKSAIEGFSVG